MVMERERALYHLSLKKEIDKKNTSYQERIKRKPFKKYGIITFKTRKMLSPIKPD